LTLADEQKLTLAGQLPALRNGVTSSCSGEDVAFAAPMVVDMVHERCNRVLPFGVVLNVITHRELFTG